jgi:DNA polymerase II small subunit
MVEEKWPAVFAECMSLGLLVGKEIKQKLLDLDDPLAVLSHAPHIGISKGTLDAAKLDALVKQHNSSGSETTPMESTSQTSHISPTPSPQAPKESSKPIGRIIAPINPPEPVAPIRLHGLPDYDINDFPVNATDVDNDIKVHFDITGNSITEGKMHDISSLFNSRLERIRRMIIAGRLPSRCSEIGKLQANRRSYTGFENLACAIGLINEPRNTKNGHLIFELEDESGAMTCLVRKSEDDPNPYIQHGLMPDDVVGVSGTFSQSGDLFYVDDLHFPPLLRRQKTSATEAAVSVAFLSDIHVGSKTFLTAQWHKMVQWFHTDPLARTIKYLILSGDCVDGVGIYPNQDKELAIPDLFDQYDEFARLLHLLPDWVECIMLPGNHDAVRPAEPQPALEAEIQQAYNTTTFVGNPCDFSLHGVRLLSYHGKSIDDYVAGMRNVTYSNPVQAMREMMTRRHLAPQWGGKTPLSPEPEDNLVITTIPDIFVTGHVHGHACTDFKGTTLVCSSTWQDQTSYQKMLGFQPKPCILTVVNLGTHKTASIPFA